MPLVLRATLRVHEAKRGASPQTNSDSTPPISLRQFAKGLSRIPVGTTDPRAQEVYRALQNLHLLMRSERLYEKDHPRRLESLDGAYDSIRNATEMLGGLEVRVERGGLVAPRIGDAHLPDARGEMQALAVDLQRAGIHALVFSKKFHVGELDTLARLLKAFPSIRKRNAGWTQCWRVSSPRWWRMVDIPRARRPMRLSGRRILTTL